MEKNISALEAFKDLRETLKEELIVAAPTIFLEILTDEESEKTTASGLVVAGAKKQVDGLAANAPAWGRVVMVHEGWSEDDGTVREPDVAVGDIVMVPYTNIQHISYFGEYMSYGKVTLAMCNEGDCLVTLKGDDAYKKAMSLLEKHNV